MEIDILSFVIGMIGAYALYCIITVWKKQTLPNIKCKFNQIKNKNNVDDTASNTNEA